MREPANAPTCVGSAVLEAREERVDSKETRVGESIAAPTPESEDTAMQRSRSVPNPAAVEEGVGGGRRRDEKLESCDEVRERVVRWVPLAQLEG